MWWWFIDTFSSCNSVSLLNSESPFKISVGSAKSFLNCDKTTSIFDSHNSFFSVPAPTLHKSTAQPHRQRNHNLISGHNLPLKQLLPSLPFPAFCRNHHDNRMQLRLDQRLLIKPKLLYRLEWVCHAVGLYQNLSDRGIGDDVLDCGYEVVSGWAERYLALQQMQPFGSSRKLLKGVPVSSTMRGCSIPISPSAN